MKIALKYDLILPLGFVIMCALKYYQVDIYREESINSIPYIIIEKSILHRMNYSHIDGQ